MSAEVLPPEDPAADKLRNVVLVCYALQALFFVAGISAIVAIVIANIKRDDARGTWLESHFLWQIRTFWWGLLWGFIGFATFIFIIGWAILFANAIWIIYRVAKGWLNLNDNKPMPV